MPKFNYTAKDKNGNSIQGNVDADDLNRAVGMIREMGYHPITVDVASIKKDTSSTSFESGSFIMRTFIFPFWTGVNIRQLAFYYRQMATLLTSGMSLSEALRSAGNRTGGRLGKIITEASIHVQNGSQISEIMNKHPRVFSMLQISLIKAGEGGGLLESMFERIASYLEYEIGIRRMVSKTMFYPALIFIVIIFAPFIPTLVLGGPLAFLKAFWLTSKVWMFYLLIFLVLMKFLLQFELTRIIWDGLKILPPILGTASVKIAMSRFSKALSVLYSAGMPISEAVNISADATANLAISRKLKCAVPALRAGKGLTESLINTQALNSMVIDMLSVGEKTGNMEVVLDKVVEHMDQEVDATINKTGVVIFVLCIIIAGVIVGTMALQTYGGYFNGMMDSAQ